MANEKETLTIAALQKRWMWVKWMEQRTEELALSPEDLCIATIQYTPFGNYLISIDALPEEQAAPQKAEAASEREIIAYEIWRNGSKPEAIVCANCVSDSETDPYLAERDGVEAQGLDACQQGESCARCGKVIG